MSDTMETTKDKDAVAKRIGLVTKVALGLVLLAITLTFMSWAIPHPILDKASEASALTILCVACYLIGLINARRMTQKMERPDKIEV